MISSSTGEISFSDGLRITAHMPAHLLPKPDSPNAIAATPLPIEGWRQYFLREHPSSLGPFTVEAVSGREGRVEGVFLSHAHSFYENDTPDDAERHAFHEAVIATDLLGQREFSWGHVFCRLDDKHNRDWLVLIYTPFSNVPLKQQEIFRLLIAHEPPPKDQ